MQNMRWCKGLNQQFPGVAISSDRQIVEFFTVRDGFASANKMVKAFLNFFQPENVGLAKSTKNR